LIMAPALGKISIWEGTLWGNGLILLGVVIFCLYSVISKKYGEEYPPFVLTKYFILTTLVTQSILLQFNLDSFEVLGTLSFKAWFSVIYVGAFSATIYYFIYQYVIKKASPVLASTTFFLQPLAGICW